MTNLPGGTIIGGQVAQSPEFAAGLEAGWPPPVPARGGLALVRIAITRWSLRLTLLGNGGLRGPHRRQRQQHPPCCVSDHEFSLVIVRAPLPGNPACTCALLMTGADSEQ
ncbi:MAG: hypothetical protein IPI73_13250 [Betaproteobacteria bacterium]|nr:hypothetical protein [Betaproteobacteria bacterium]